MTMQRLYCVDMVYVFGCVELDSSNHDEQRVKIPAPHRTAPAQQKGLFHVLAAAIAAGKTGCVQGDGSQIDGHGISVSNSS